MERTTASETILRELLALPDQPARVARVAAYVEELATSEAAAHFLTQLKDLSESHLATSSHLAREVAELLIHTAELVEQPLHRALGLLAKADALRMQGDFEQAALLYDQSGALCLTLQERVAWARTRTGWLLANHYLGHGQQVLGSVEEALGILVEAQQFLRAGGLSLNAGLVCYELGQYQRSSELYQQAQRFYRLAADQQPDRSANIELREAKAKANMALNQALLGDFPSAIGLYTEARDVFQHHNDPDSALRVEHYIAALYAGQGQLTRALRVHADALAAAEKAGLADTVVEVALEMVRCYAGLNRHADALNLAEQLVARCEATHSPTEAAKARLACAQSLAALGKIDQALDTLTRAAQVFGETGQSAELASTDLLRSRLELARANFPSALEAASAAQQVFVECGLTIPRAQAELILARAHLRLSDVERARQHAQQALDLTHARGLLPLSQQAHHLLAEATDEPAQALAEYDRSIADLEQVQSRLATQLRVDFLGDKLQVFQDAIDAALRLGDARRALGYLERAKSRALVDYLTSQADLHVRARDPGEQSLLDELSALRDEHHWFYSRLHGLASQAVAGEGEHSALQAAVAEREQRITRLLERLALLRDAEGLEALGWRPDGQSLQLPTLGPGTVMLEYLLREDDGLVFVLTADTLDVQPLPSGARALRRLLGRWQLNLDSVTSAIGSGQPLEALAPNARAVLQSFYKALVEPVRGYLHDADRLIVVPYGPAHAVPFQALFDGQRHLLEHVQVSTSPSAALLQLTQRRPVSTGRGALVVGNTNGGRLPSVLSEAQAVAALLGGTCLLEERATRAAVLDEAPKRDVLHLAAHGEARLDNPLFAHLHLADGQLGMVDVFNLRLDGALVTLSACETGRSLVVGGDELVGLSRGFLFAGAATLVHSLWRVEDDSTARLMQCFYGDLMRGSSPGAALRRAQRSLLEEGCHPHLWAAFQLTGRDS